MEVTHDEKVLVTITLDEDEAATLGGILSDVSLDDLEPDEAEFVNDLVEELSA